MAESDEIAQIIVGCKAGDSESFEKLIDMYAGRCYGYFYRLTGNRQVSDDLLSELLFKLVVKIGSFKGGSFTAWLFKTASNIFHDYLRQKQQQHKMLDARRIEVESRLKEAKRAGLDRIDKLQTQLEKLDADQRELIILRFYSQLKFREMAQLRGEPIGTVLSKVHRALQRLRELMEA